MSLAFLWPSFFHDKLSHSFRSHLNFRQTLSDHLASPERSRDPKLHPPSLTPKRFVVNSSSTSFLVVAQGPTTCLVSPPFSSALEQLRSLHARALCCISCPVRSLVFSSHAVKATCVIPASTRLAPRSIRVPARVGILRESKFGRPTRKGALWLLVVVRISKACTSSSSRPCYTTHHLASNCDRRQPDTPAPQPYPCNSASRLHISRAVSWILLTQNERPCGGRLDQWPCDVSSTRPRSWDPAN